jgi:hypothetical protein
MDAAEIFPRYIVAGSQVLRICSASPFTAPKLRMENSPRPAVTAKMHMKEAMTFERTEKFLSAEKMDMTSPNASLAADRANDLIPRPGDSMRVSSSS